MHSSKQALNQRAFVQLRNVIQELGQGGGSMTPSIYDTAQILRFCPEIVQVDKVVDWLLRSQYADGGWGEPAAPLYRDVPTLAALLALHPYRHQHDRVRCACSAAHRFLAEQAKVLEPADGEYLPVAMELIVPCLLEQAEEMGLALARTRYRYLEGLGAKRRQMLAAHRPAPNSAPVFSWEAWGTEPDPELVTCAGVGHSPAASAWWLYLDKQRSAANVPRIKARNYILQASLAAQGGIQGLAPNACPMNRYEQSFTLHMIATAGLLGSHQLAGVLGPQLDDLRLALTPQGLGFSDSFTPDGDDTAAAVAVLATAGMPVDQAVLTPFERSDHFAAYPFETHSSYTVTARASQALRCLGYDTCRWRYSILAAQQPDGWWSSDKWNCSRIYGTFVALGALDENAGHAKAVAAQAFLKYQHDDGGWGCVGRSTLVETAFGVLALCNIALESGCEVECFGAISAAHRFLRQNASARRIATEHTWICKDLNSARRIDQATVLCALLAPEAFSKSLWCEGRQPHSHSQRAVAP